LPTQRNDELEAAVRRDLRRFPPQARRSARAAAALAIARRMDDAACAECGGTSLGPRDLAALTGRLDLVLASLEKAVPPVPVKDGIDDLAARRRARRAG